MEIKGKLLRKLQAESGTSKTGKTWISQTCIVETEDKFNNIVAIKCAGDEKIKQMNKLKDGSMVNISCNVYSREYNGKFYNNIDGWWFADQSQVDENDTNEFVTSDDIPF